MVAKTLPSSEQVWAMLEEVKDPEIPVVSVVEMGIVRQVEAEGASIRVTMTPTFAGCPAVQVMRLEIRQKLEQAGFERVEVVASNNPPWSSDWLSPETKQKLLAFGLSTPARHGGDLETALAQPVPCPYCGSQDTTVQNEFGPTLCRAIYTCNACKQPFERFKPL